MYQYKTTPFDHQRVALNRGGLLTNFAILWKWVQVRQK